MSEFEPKPCDDDIYQQEIAKIPNHVERAAFDFFFNTTKKESLDVLPHYSWDQFHDGIAPFNELPISVVDNFVESTGIIPNYTRESTDQNGLVDTVPVLDALRGSFIQSLHRSCQDSAVRVVGIHPSLASPLVFTRSIAAAYKAEFNEDIRSRIYVVYGAYPLTMKYNMCSPTSGEFMGVSPVDIGRSMANLVITAPKTANTSTDNSDVQTWLDATRAVFRLRNREILSEPGNILIVHPAGRRGQRSNAKTPPFFHKEYLPEGKAKYITDVDVPTYVIGIDDQLLTDPSHPESVVNVAGHPRPRRIRNDLELVDALRVSAVLSSSENDIYSLELEMMADRAKRLVGKVAMLHEGHNQSSE